MAHDPVEESPVRRAGKGPSPDLAPVQGAVRPDDAGAEGLAQLVDYPGPLDHLVSYPVGVDNGGAALGQEPSQRRLARPNAACQA